MRRGPQRHAAVDALVDAALVRGIRVEGGRAALDEVAELDEPDDIDEETIGARLYTAGLPDPDLLIRTSGDQRVSYFLLWQIAYSELYITSVPWPEFRQPQLEKAFRAFSSRQRRFGRTGDQVEGEG